MLHASIGIFEATTTVSKKVMNLHDSESIGIAIGFWSDTLTKHLRSENKNDLASKMVQEFSDFRRALDRFHLLTTFKESTAGLFNDTVVEWAQSNTDIALRTPLNKIAHEKIASYLVTANAIYEKKRMATEKAEKEKASTKSNNYPPRYNFSRFNTPQNRFAQTTADGKTICIKFNRGQCTGNCKYEHICSLCTKGPHPAFRCFQRNNNNSNATANTIKKD